MLRAVWNTSTTSNLDLLSMVGTTPEPEYVESNTSTVVLSLLACVSAFTAYKKYNAKMISNDGDLKDKLVV